MKQGGAWCAACLVPWSPATLVRRRRVGLGVSLMCRWEVCVRVSNGGVGKGGERRVFRGHVWKGWQAQSISYYRVNWGGWVRRELTIGAASVPMKQQNNLQLRKKRRRLRTTCRYHNKPIECLGLLTAAIQTASVVVYASSVGLVWSWLSSFSMTLSQAIFFSLLSRTASCSSSFAVTHKNSKN